MRQYAEGVTRLRHSPQDEWGFTCAALMMNRASRLSPPHAGGCTRATRSRARGDIRENARKRANEWTCSRRTSIRTKKRPRSRYHRRPRRQARSPLRPGEGRSSACPVARDRRPGRVPRQPVRAIPVSQKAVGTIATRDPPLFRWTHRRPAEGSDQQEPDPEPRATPLTPCGRKASRADKTPATAGRGAHRITSPDERHTVRRGPPCAGEAGLHHKGNPYRLQGATHPRTRGVSPPPCEPSTAPEAGGTPSKRRAQQTHLPNT